MGFGWRRGLATPRSSPAGTGAARDPKYPRRKARVEEEEEERWGCRWELGTGERGDSWAVVPAHVAELGRG